MRNGKTCEDCIFFSAMPNPCCRYNPPTAHALLIPAGNPIAGRVGVNLQITGAFPPVNPKQDWCGEFCEPPMIERVQ